MAVDNQRVALYSFVCIGLVTWYILWKAFGSVVQLTIPGEIIFGIELENLMGLLAAAVAAVAGAISWRNEKVNRFSTEVVVELKKVTWPNKKDLRGATIIVIVMTIAIALILFAFDKILDTVMKLVI